MNDEYSTGNDIVDEVGKINISGNIIPIVWFQTIKYPNGKPNVNAIIILADIVYWYRPTEIRDEYTGQIIGIRKKFREDLLQRNYQQLGEQFGFTKKQVVDAVNALQAIGVVKKDFRNLKVSGQCINNVLYLELNPQRLYEITYPEKSQCLSVSTYKSGGGNIKVGILPTYKEEGVNLKVDTNTENTTKNTTRDYNNPINLSAEYMDDVDKMEMIDVYTQIVKENIEYDFLVQSCRFGEKEIIDGIVDLIVEIVSIEQETIKIGSLDYPYQLVKGKFLKLQGDHIRYVLECMSKNTTKVRNIKSYLLTALFNAPSTIGSYYQAEVNHDMHGGENRY